VHIVIAADGSVTLDQPTEFTAFDIRSADPSPPAVTAALGSGGSDAPEEGHVFVAVAAIRELVGAAADESWEAGLAAMLAYARSRGWTDESGELIKAHIQAVGGP
jgi:hypothetical protein